MKISQRVGRNLARIRNERGLSQVALSTATGVSRQTLSNIEKGAHAPSTKMLGLLAWGLDADVRDFFEPIKEGE